MSHAERKEAYAADIVYCTNKELVFDYLRDKQELAKVEHPMMAHSARLRGALDGRRLLLRGLHFAIVDEADSVLLDEARTPLVLSGRSPGDGLDIHVIDKALDVAKSYVDGLDFVKERGSIYLTSRGKERLEESLAGLLGSRSGGWLGRSRREWLIQQALLACHHFRRDQHYLVKDGKVQIIDEQTGRTMPDRSWQKGLHQMIERLEGCKASDSSDTLSRLTYQRFFRRYYHLCGMTGTASEVKSEIWVTYRMKVVSIPPNRESQRKYYPTVLQESYFERAQWISRRIIYFTAKGRPVLVTTVTLADAERLSEELERSGIEHRVLSARQDANEAEVIAMAGVTGSVTLATSMAGRGTDIALDANARAAGGLHVIIAGRHDSSRVVRQIAGRCARQGDPGSVEMVVLRDEPILSELDGIAFQVGSHSRRLRRAQKHREKRFERERSKLLVADWKESELLGFSGRGE